ncbi:MAG: hypothetical protein HYV20_13120 [Gemmatimonadetes bacterium]|nr:hypothetical protein [Gemmatimonadota bacterium]
MNRMPLRSLAAVAVLATACALGTEPQITESLLPAFQSVPPGFSNATSSFAGDSATGNPEWGPQGRHGGRGHGPGRGMGPGAGFGSFMMGGGLGGLFMGHGFGPGFGRGRHGDLRYLPGDCDYDSSSGRVVCEPETRNGLTITRSAAYYDADGQLQTGFDSLTTNTINLQIGVSGTRIRRDGDTSTLQHASDRTVSGLAPGSTQRTVDGTSAGEETTVGTNDQGHFTALRIIGDTIQGVVIPVEAGTRIYPVAGTVIRSMQATVTYDGQDPVTSSRREVITYDGSDTATIVITHDGETKTCTFTLPRGRLACP